MFNKAFIRAFCDLIMPRNKGGYYAVHRGRETGVFMSWSECEEQVKGFTSASFKKFATADEALNFAKHGNKPSVSVAKVDSFEQQAAAGTGSQWFSKTVPQNSTGITNYETKSNLIIPSTYSKPQKNAYYAVHRGKQPGVYKTWTECEAQIKNFKNPSYRKFSTEEEALNYAQTGGIKKVSRRSAKHIEINQDFALKKQKVDDEDFSLDALKVDPSKTVTVFTDGASSKNGKVGAKAGIGVYWGPNHPLNTSMKLPGRQTNNRAEIYAAVHALKQAKQIGAENVKLYTDSQFLIHGITDWINKWQKNGWKLGTGKPVVNKDDFIELDKAREGLNVDWIYIKAHDNNPGNVEADRLAVEGAKKSLSETEIYLI